MYPEDAGDGVFRYVRNGRREFAGSLEQVLDWIVWDMVSVVPRWARDYLFLHAGAVSLSGRALLLPARRDAGKSTTVAALLARGCDYLSDELGALDPVTARAYPFAKRLSLDQDALRFFAGLEERLSDRAALGGALRKRSVRPEDLDARAGGAASVAWIVFPSEDRDGPPRLRPVARAEAIERMARNCFNLYRYAERGVVLLSRVAADAQAYELTGGDPRARAGLLLDALA